MRLLPKKLMISVRFLLAALLFAFAAWLGSQPAIAQSGSTAAAQTSAAKHHVVVIKNFAYQPATITVKKGDTLEWKNEDIVAHTVTANDKSFDSGSIAAGSSWKFTAKKAGNFDYICTFHPNMKAKLIVQ
ncbi:MAG: cupredoxin family copper-binding protein [Bryobacterales bacterium]|nr:cupredoxin family copper-binding protein [Bryobacterales bacterium]